MHVDAIATWPVFEDYMKNHMSLVARESKEGYQLPEPTSRHALITKIIGELRDELKPLKSQLLKHLAVDITVNDISDLINSGLCHVFAMMVKARVELAGIELELHGDPFHVWLHDPKDGYHYDAFFVLGTRYRDELDGGYCADDDGECWDRERLRAEYPEFESKLRQVWETIHAKDPESPFLVVEIPEY
jgi:hypothetical protein